MTNLTSKRERVKSQKQRSKIKPTPSHNEKIPLSKDKQPEVGIQENLLTLLYHFRVSGKHVLKLDPRLFSGDYQVFAQRAMDHWRKFGEPPGRAHAADLFLKELRDPDRQGRASTYRNILNNMLAMKQDPTFNPKVVRAQLQDFVRHQTMKQGILRMAELNESLGPDGDSQVLDVFHKMQQATPSSRVLTTRTADQFEDLKLEWEWYPFIPRAAITGIISDGDIGKSTILIDLVARITTGRAMPTIGDDPPAKQKPRSALIVCKENDISRIIKPRLRAAGANLERVHFLGYDLDDGFNPIDRMDNCSADIDDIVARNKIGFAYIDPITEFVGKVDTYRDEQIRGFIHSLYQIATRHNLAIAYTLHLNKKTDLPMQYRGLGGVGHRNTSLSWLVLAMSQEQPGLRLLHQNKGNLLPHGDNRRTAGCRFESVKLDVGSFAKVVWESEWQDVDPDTLLAGPKQSNKRDKAKAFLQGWLQEGPQHVNLLIERAQATGISWPTFRQAKIDLGVKSKKKSSRFGSEFIWRLA